MQQVSRKLLFAGVLAFGTLAAACGDKINIVAPTTPVPTITGVTVTPQNAAINVGTSITLSASVTGDASLAKTVTWTTSNAAVATVDGTGKVTGISQGTVTIIATSTADTKVSGAAAIVVNPAVVVITVPPSIAINSVTQGGTLFPVNLSNTAGQIDVTVNTSGGGLIEVFLSSTCTTNTISAADVAVATQQATSAQAGVVTLSFNTAQLTASNAPRFPNGNYCIKARLTNGTASVVATNTTPITLNNSNVFRGTFVFTSQTTFANGTPGPTSAVSGTNGLNYNQGTLTVTLNPVVFTSTSPVALISGYLTRNGEQSGVAAPTGNVAFTNSTVTAGAATIAFTDTGTTGGVRSIFGYNSLPAGDTLYITSATDAAGNPITVTPTPGSPAFVVAGGVRIDNDVPILAAYTVTAPNGYIGAGYTFSSGTTGTATDTHAGVAGVNTVTTQYFVGPAGGTTFAAGSCSVTGLTLVTSGNDLANTNAINPDQAKVIVTDALGNKSCAIVTVTTTTGSPTTFGVDKVAPTITIVPPAPANAPAGFADNNGAAANTGYNVSKNFSFVYTDSISGFTNGVVLTPLKGTLTKNFFTAGTSAAADCVVGTYSTTAKTCSAVSITPTSTLSAGGNTAPFNVNSIEFTNGTGTNGYFLFTGTVTDLAGNVSNSVSRLAAFDNVAPGIGALTQSPAAAVSLGTVTVSGAATDNVDLTSSSGRLAYLTAPNPFQSVAGTSFGPDFVPAVQLTGTASVALSNVYRGLQNTTGNVINAGGVAPSATVTVTDVGGNSTTSAPLTIAMSTTRADILVGNTFVGTASVGAAPATRQASTNVNVNVTGLISDPAFQSQPFALVELYKVSGGELVLVASTGAPIVTDVAPNRTYTYPIAGVALTAGATSTYYAVGRNAAGDAVISGPITIANP